MHILNDSHHGQDSCVNAAFEKQYKIQVFPRTKETE